MCDRREIVMQFQLEAKADGACMEECWLCIEYEEPGIGTCCRPLEFHHHEHICCLCLAETSRQLTAAKWSPIIAPMEWNISDRRTCIDWWKSRIGKEISRANGDVHMFILSQLFAFLLRKKRK